MNKKLFGMLALLSMMVSLSAYASTVTGTISSGITSGGGMAGDVPYKPSASVAAGTYHTNQSVVLSSSGATSIRYTTDGTVPTCASGALYTSAVSVSQSLTMQVVACKDSSASSVASFDYVLNCSVSSVSNGSVAAYPSCAVTCNSGYTLSNGSCVSSGGGSALGGSRGGGGGGSAPVPSPTAPITSTPSATLAALITSLQTLLARAQSQGLITASFASQILTGIGSPSAPSSPVSVITTPPMFTTPFTQALWLGDSGPEVTRLQTFLKNQGSSIYPEGLITGYFGQATLRAVQRFQVLYGIAHAGDKGYGFVGPATRAKINSLLGL